MISPPHAARTWVSEGLIYMEFNSPLCELLHTVHFPATPDGMALALDILKARTPKSLLSSKGAPIQHDVEKLAKDFLKKGGKIVKKTGNKFTDNQHANARDVMRSLGLI